MNPPDSRILVETSLPNERLDAWLKSRFPVVSRGAIQRLLKEGNIRVNDQPVKAAHHPQSGEIITIAWPEPRPARARPQEIDLEILYEDVDVLVINKPPGMVVHPSAGHEENTLVNALLHYCEGRLSGIGGVSRPGIVHRLDKETSGCLVVAKNDSAHLLLSEQFAGRDVKKVYRALVCGHVESDSGEIRAAIARHPNHRKRMAVTGGGGRDAWTSYTVIKRLRECTLVEALLHTGRTHQIRVHFLHVGHPLVGDGTYGKRHNNRFKEVTGFHAPRQLLHAHHIEFIHPNTRERMKFIAPLPADFLSAIEELEE